MLMLMMMMWLAAWASWPRADVRWCFAHTRPYSHARSWSPCPTSRSPARLGSLAPSSPPSRCGPPACASTRLCRRATPWHSGHWTRSPAHRPSPTRQLLTANATTTTTSWQPLECVDGTRVIGESAHTLAVVCIPNADSVVTRSAGELCFLINNN